MSPKEVIQTIIPKLLSEWAMMLAEPIDSNASVLDSAEPVVIASVAFSGPFTGTFRVGSQRKFLHVLSDNLVGDSTPATKDSEMLDTVKEFCNVLTGNLLTELYGADVAFALESPTIRCIDLAAMAATFDERTMCFSAEECPFVFQFELEV